jgi:hypothetical protein
VDEEAEAEEMGALDVVTAVAAEPQTAALPPLPARPAPKLLPQLPPAAPLLSLLPPLPALAPLPALPPPAALLLPPPAGGLHAPDASASATRAEFAARVAAFKQLCEEGSISGHTLDEGVKKLVESLASAPVP